jgi:hypothetical protein
MPKKKKMSLSPIKVQSFVTTLDDKQKNKVKGGATYDCTPDSCPGGTCPPTWNASCEGTCDTCASDCTCFNTCDNTCTCGTLCFTCDTCSCHCPPETPIACPTIP